MLRAVCKSMLVVLLCCQGMASAGETPPSSVKDLQYGEMLFYYYQKDYFNSIVRLDIARQQERLPNHADEAELMLGGLELSYGMRDEARQIFQKLLDDKNNNVSVHNRAWLYLAKISYQRGDLQGALDAIVNVGDETSPSTRTATANLKSLLLLEAGRNAEAIEVLESLQTGKHWEPYLQYNLGVAQLRNGQDSEGEETLDNVSNLKVAQQNELFCATRRTWLSATNIYSRGKQKNPGKHWKKFTCRVPSQTRHYSVQAGPMLKPASMKKR